MAESGLHIFSVGTVAKDKPENSQEIDVIPVQTNHMFNDEVDKTEKETQLTSKDGNGTPMPITSKTSQTITAKWLAFGGGGNRVTAPDVKKGEAVTIWRFGDTNDYFWEKHYTELELRRLERVLWMFGGIPGAGAKLDEENSYWLLMSTMDKLVRLHTSKSNGEPFPWDFKLDTARGTFSITDNTGITYTLDASTGEVTTNAENTITDNTQQRVINASTSTTINSPETEVTGNESVGGNLTVAGGLSAGGGARSRAALRHQLTGDLHVIGSITQTGDIIIDGNIQCSGNINSGGSISAAGTVSGTNI